MNGDEAATSEGTNVGPPFFVERKIPSGDRLAPVANRLGERLSPIRPICRIVGSRIVGTAFGPMQLRLGMCFVHLAHHVRRADISMKRDRIAKLAQAVIVEFANGAAPKVVVVVK